MSRQNRAEYQRRWRRENPASNKASQRKYYLKHKREMDEYRNRWIADNRDKVSIYREKTLANRKILRPNFGKEDYWKHRDRILSTQTAYRHRNADAVRAGRRKSYHKNKANRAAYNKRYYELNREKIKSAKRAWDAKNRPRIREYVLAKLKNDPNARMRQRLSSKINRILKRLKSKKLSSTTELVGCSVPFLRQHLASLWKPRMTWENRSEWHIDHIKPCASFDLTQRDQQKECFNYTNLQPLWGPENIRKSSWWNGVLHKSKKEVAI